MVGVGLYPLNGETLDEIAMDYFFRLENAIPPKRTDNGYVVVGLLNGFKVVTVFVRGDDPRKYGCTTVLGDDHPDVENILASVVEK